MSEHLCPEQGEQFLDAFARGDGETLPGVEAHLAECGACRAMIVETRLVEQRLRAAFTRTERGVGVDDVTRARPQWHAAPASAPLSVGTGPIVAGPLALVRSLPDEDVGAARGSETPMWRRWSVAPLIAASAIALIGLSASRALRASRQPIIAAATPAATVAEPTTIGSTIASPPRATASVASHPPTRASRPAAAPVIERVRIRETRESREAASAAALAERNASSMEFVVQVAEQLSPILRMEFLSCVQAGEAALMPACLDAFARARLQSARMAIGTSAWPDGSTGAMARAHSEAWGVLEAQLVRKSTSGNDRGDMDASPRNEVDRAQR